MTELSFLLGILTGFGQVVAHPLFYVALLLVLLQVRRQNDMERRMFGVRATLFGDHVLRSLFFGIGGGLAATLLLAGVGVVLSPVDLIYVWVLALMLMLVNARFICFAYAGGILSVISLLLNVLPVLAAGPDWLLRVYTDIRNMQVADLLALVAILHLIEALLVRYNGASHPMPVFVSGKRGRLVGGFILQKSWVVPMGAFVAVGANTGFSAPDWWPLMSLGAVAAGTLQVVPVPAVLGFSNVALTKTPQVKANHTAKMLMLYSLILLGLAIGGSYWTGLLWVAAIFCFAAHEALIFWEIHGEQTGQAIYVKPLQGLKILAVLPNSPAMGMGLLSGETIVKANGMPVNTPYDLHFAINQNPAFVKLEVLTPEGEPRFAGTPIYTGDHHQLGIILVPDDQARQYLSLQSIRPWRWLWGKLVGGGKQAPSTYH